MSRATTKEPVGLTDVDGRLKSKVELEVEEPSAEVGFETLGRIGPAIVVVVLCVVGVYLIPGLQWARPWQPGEPVPFWNVAGRPFESEELDETHKRAEEVEEIAKEVESEVPPPQKPQRRPKIKPGEKYEPHPDDLKDVTQSVELFEGDELDDFFASLTKTDQQVDAVVTRVMHWGDSAIGLDGIPGAIRRRMQNRFGDAGHGFHLIAPPNTSYVHREVRFRHNDTWDLCFIIFRCRKDGHYGLGGATFRSMGGAKSSFSPHAKRSSGNVSKFEVWYAGQPHGGRLGIRVDKEDEVIVETKAETLEDRWHTIEVEDAPHKLSVRAASGRVRLYGVAMERSGPGVVWDSAALVGAFTNRMLAYDEDHLRSQLEHRGSDLAVLTFGGNDMIRDIPMSEYAEEYGEVIKLLKKVRPQMSCLVMAPLDHGVRKGRQIVTLPIVPEMVEAQREAAKAQGCAFFDTYQAMGGEGAAGRWFKREPRLMGGDLGHATGKGHQVIGELLFRGLVEAYVDYRRRQEAEG